MVKTGGIKTQKPEKSMFRTNANNVLRHRPKKGPMCLRSRLMGRCLRPFILPRDDC